MSDVDYRALFPQGQDTETKRLTNCWDPQHKDSTPSLHINLKNGVWRCYGCGISGTARSYVKDWLKEDPKKYGIQLYLSRDMVARYHQALLRNQEALNYLLRIRQLKLKVVKDFQIGYDEDAKRFTIPIPDESGRFVNIRRYLPNCPPTEQKFLNLGKGRGIPQLYPTLKPGRSSVTIVAGEIDLLGAYSRDLYAITTTAGEGYWNDRWSEIFRGLDVNICYDIDETGRKGAKKVATALLPYAKSIKIIDLSLDGLTEDKFPKGDLSDYFCLLGKTRKDFNRLVKSTPLFISEEVQRENDTLLSTEIFNVSFKSALDSVYGNKLTRFVAKVAGKDQVPYLIPRSVTIICGETAGLLCSRCKCQGKGGNTETTFDSSDPRLLALIKVNEATAKAVTKDLIGVPQKCNQHVQKINEYANLEEVHLIRPTVEEEYEDFSNQEHITRVGYHHYKDEPSMDWNSIYEVTARTVREPIRGHSVHLIKETKPKEDDLETFRLSPEEMDNLRSTFQCEGTVEGVEQKIQDIASEHSHNVTRIYGRPDIHIATDLVYHSVLYFNWNGKTIRGYLEILFAGDTRQGKSDTVQNLRRFYRLGDKIDCSRATVAGLIGGAKELSNGHWSIEWGVLPINDRRLVILEEVKNLSVEQIAALKEVRSSGVAEVTAIRRDRTPARVRSIWVANPRSSRKVATYSYGIDIIRELIGDPENIARFDSALIVSDSEEEVSRATLQASFQQRSTDNAGRYTAELCRSLVLFIWSRRPDQIRFASGVEETVLTLSKQITDKYDDTFPLVQSADFRFKLLRISTAIAARVFSVESENIVVYPYHIEYAAKLLNEWYSKPCFGYDVYSYDIKKANSLDDVEAIENAIANTAHPLFMVDTLIAVNLFNRTQLAEWANIEKEDATRLCHTLLRCRAISAYDASRYKKSAAFIQFLKQLRQKFVKESIA